MKILVEHTLKNYKINDNDTLCFIIALLLPFHSKYVARLHRNNGHKTRRATYIYPKSDRAEHYTGIT